MRLTLHTDYAIRVLLHLAAHTEGLSSVAEIARAYGISRNHLMKVVQTLSKAGVVHAVRGRSGGLRLGRPPEQITVGDVVRQTEEGFQLVDCSACVITGACELPPILNQATRAFLAVLDSHTVADLLKRRQSLQMILGLRSARPAARRFTTLPRSQAIAEGRPRSPTTPPRTQASG